MKATRYLAPLALAFASMTGTAMAQNLSPVPVIVQGNTLLSVNAEGSATRKPDMAVFNAGVASTGKTAGEAMAANAADMNRVVAALKKAGIADKDIQTSNLSLNPIYADTSHTPPDAYGQQLPRIIGYQANNSVTVRQRDLAQFGKVIDTLVSAGANQVNGPEFKLDNDDAAMDEARTKAVGIARQRANLYAKAAGLRVVRILSISESGGYSPQPVMYARAAAADMGGAQTPVQAGEVGLNVQVSVQFELAP